MYLSVGGTRTEEAPRARRDEATGRELILKLTCWARGTNPLTLGRTRARAHQVGEPKETETEVENVFGRSLVGTFRSVAVRASVAMRTCLSSSCFPKKCSSKSLLSEAVLLESFTCPPSSNTDLSFSWVRLWGLVSSV